MKLLSHLLFFIILLSLGIAMSCGCEKVPATFKITDIGIHEAKRKFIPNTETTIEGDSVYSFEQGTIIDANDTVHYADAGFRFATTSYFLSSGCDPQPTKPTQKFSSLEITSASEYITTEKIYQAGESLLGIFQLEGHAEVQGIIGQLAEHNHPHYFSLIIPPTDLSLHNFTFYVTLDDGSTFTAISEPINIAP